MVWPLTLQLVYHWVYPQSLPGPPRRPCPPPHTPTPSRNTCFDRTTFSDYAYNHTIWLAENHCGYQDPQNALRVPPPRSSEGVSRSSLDNVSAQERVIEKKDRMDWFQSKICSPLGLMQMISPLWSSERSGKGGVTPTMGAMTYITKWASVSFPIFGIPPVVLRVFSGVTLGWVQGTLWGVGD